METDNRQYQIASLAPSWSLDESLSGALLYNTATGHRLRCNNSARQILTLVDGLRTVGEITGELVERYAQESQSLLTEVDDLLKYLHDTGALEWRSNTAIEQRAALLASFTPEPERPGNNPFDYFQAIFCINRIDDEMRWNHMQARFATLGIADRVIRFPAVETPTSHHIGCTLSHRLLTGLAAEHGLDNCLVFEDDALLLDSTMEMLPDIVSDLQRTDWKLFYLGACLLYGAPPLLPGFSGLRDSAGLTCTHAIAYSSRSYAQILAQIPDSIAGLWPWMDQYLAIDQYLAQHVSDGYLAYPTLAAQQQLLEWEDPALAPRYL